MSNQMKLILYIVFVVGIFLFIQTKFNIFDVKLVNNDNTSNTAENSNKVSSSNNDSGVVNTDQNYVEIVTGANQLVKVNVEIADTDVKRNTGLSYRKYLGDYDGMLFVFDKKSSTPFWMKAMEIPLDIIFIDEQSFIIDVKEAQAPCTTTYCPAIYSLESYKYVLEVNSGFCEKNNVAVGGSIILHLTSIN